MHNYFRSRSYIYHPGLPGYEAAKLNRANRLRNKHRR